MTNRGQCTGFMGVSASLIFGQLCILWRVAWSTLAWPCLVGIDEVGGFDFATRHPGVLRVCAG
jgi:hypothetical protein